MLNQKYCSLHPGLDICQYNDQMQFIFKYYLRGRSPDLLFMFSTFAHLKAPIGQMLRDMMLLHEIVQTSVASSSHILYFPSTKPNWQITNKSKDIKIPEEGWNRLVKIEVLNHCLVEMIKSKVNNSIEGLSSSVESLNRNVEGFLDVWSIGAARELVWATDLVHFKNKYYDTVMNLLLKLLPTLS